MNHPEPIVVEDRDVYTFFAEDRRALVRHCAAGFAQDWTGQGSAKGTATVAHIEGRRVVLTVEHVGSSHSRDALESALS